MIKPGNKRETWTAISGKSEEGKDRPDVIKRVEEPGGWKETCAAISDRSERVKVGQVLQRV